MTTVWITGASSGIGAALAKIAADKGCSVILSARRTDLLEAVRASLPRPEDVKILPLDVADIGAMKAAAAEAWAWRDGVDTLINNAGISQRGTALDTTLETSRRLMEVNFFGAVALTQAVLPQMVARDRGHVVFVSSVAGYVSTPMRSSYAAAKHAIRAWADALRAELDGTNLAVTVLVPGYIATGISGLALTADGAPNGRVEPTDSGGVPVDVACARMWKGIEKRAPEVIVGGREVNAIYLKRFAPGLVVKLLPKFGKTRPPTSET